MNTKDSFYKKTVSYQHGTHPLQFSVSQELFSSLDIDHGTQRLLRTLLFQNISTCTKVLDLGCGYGPIGIAVKKVCPTAELRMVDVDSLALEFAEENAVLNAITDAHVYASIGYDQIEDNNFDLIVSNIPAKIGPQALTHFLKDAQHHLVPGGKVIIVVIDAIADFVAEQLEKDVNITITYQRTWPGHTVYHYQFVTQNPQAAHSLSSFEQGIFSRGSHTIEYKNQEYVFDVSYTLAEFDQLSFQTKLAMKALKKFTGAVRSALVFPVGQGYLPFFVAQRFRLSELDLSDRQYLALKTTEKNLKRFGITSKLHHSSIPHTAQQFDLIVGELPEKQTTAAYTEYLDSIRTSLTPTGRAMLLSSSTTLSRLSEQLSTRFKILDSDRDHGSTVAEVQ